MSVPTTANYVFLPWVRQGAASDIQVADSLGDSQAGVVSVPVRLQVNNTENIDRQIRLYGPGDVTGIDSQQVVRTDPSQFATNFEANLFPAIEFDRPDFPWIFTPAKAGKKNRLRPWLCLIVVRKQDGVSLRSNSSLPLPVLEIIPPARPGLELPDLSESWAWAHVQVTGSRPEASSLKASLSGNPALTVSRLLSPRRLSPATDYLACVVPAFALGCKAGLGQPIVPADEARLAPAWRSGAQAPAQISLPVYFHWEFRTGSGGDFEALVRLLQPRVIPPEVGKRSIDISQPGFRLDPSLPPGSTLALEGALRAADSPAADWPVATREVFQTGLKDIVNIPWEATTQNQGNKEPLLAPPIYGCWQAARHLVAIMPDPPWLDELNLDPRHRAVAALGTRVVQTQQEQLMAAAWEQLGDIKRINQMRRQAQLARAVNGVYRSRHFARFSEEALLKVVASAQSRIVIETAGASNTRSRTMLSHQITMSTIPDRAVSAQVRRMTSPLGVLSVRFQANAAPATSFVARLNSHTGIALPDKAKTGLVTLDRVAEELNSAPLAALKQSIRFDRIATALDTAPGLGGAFTTAAEGTMRSVMDFQRGQPDSIDATIFKKAAGGLQDYLLTKSLATTTAIAAPPLDLARTRLALLQSIDPEKTLTARVQASIVLADTTVTSDDPLEPILDAPDFPQPMYEALRDISQDFLLPGLEHVPANTVTLLETNSRFVESFLVGLNSEMNREMLWRNYPTDQRATFFRRFWDNAGEKPDIDMIRRWGDSRLGENSGADEQLVLLLRGDLLRRYPSSVIYAARAGADGRLDPAPSGDAERHPLFRGTLKPDVTFLGFNLKKEEAIADPGWFFVIQQQPTEPCFGMDAADFDHPLPPLTNWNELSWRHLAPTRDELEAMSYASITTVLPELDKATWGKNSTHQAYITLQRPVRIAIHAKQMILQG